MVRCPRAASRNGLQKTSDPGQLFGTDQSIKTAMPVPGHGGFFVRFQFHAETQTSRCGQMPSGLNDTEKRQKPASDLRKCDPEGLHAERACERASGRGGQLQLFRAHVFRKVSQSGCGASSRGRGLRAAFFSLALSMPDRHCCRGQRSERWFNLLNCQMVQPHNLAEVRNSTDVSKIRLDLLA